MRKNRLFQHKLEPGSDAGYCQEDRCLAQKHHRLWPDSSQWQVYDLKRYSAALGAHCSIAATLANSSEGGRCLVRTAAASCALAVAKSTPTSAEGGTGWKSTLQKSEIKHHQTPLNLYSCLFCFYINMCYLFFVRPIVGSFST